MVGSHPPCARVAQGSEAQLGHPSRDCASLAPEAVRSSRWIFRLGCWLHEESILLQGDGISSRDQWREALCIGLSMGARGLGITTLFLFDHFDVGDLLLLLLLVDLLLLLLADLLLLLLADLLLQAGLVFLNAADLLQHATILNEVFELHDGSLHHVEGGLQSV